MTKADLSLEKTTRIAGPAIAAVLIATVATFLISPFLGGRAPMGMFLVAITLVATKHGLYPALVATGLSLGIVHYLFADNLAIVLEQQSLLAVLAIAGTITSYLGSRVYRVNRQLEQAKADLEAVNNKLLEQAEWLAEANARLAQRD